MLAIIDRCNDL